MLEAHQVISHILQQVCHLVSLYVIRHQPYMRICWCHMVAIVKLQHLCGSHQMGR